MSTWLKAGELPNWATLAIGAFVYRAPEAGGSAWRPVESNNRYEIYSFDGRIGRVVATGIDNEANAHLIAAAPGLFDACAAAWAVLDDDANQGRIDLVARLRAVLDLAEGSDPTAVDATDRLAAAPSTTSAAALPWTRPRRKRVATRELHASVEDGVLKVYFDGGPSHEWLLPPKTDKEGLRRVRGEALAWVRKFGATSGQEDYIKKALTTAGYHLSK